MVGMFGDTMQRIYLGGKENVAHCISDDWEKPQKVMNHRRAIRIVQLANTISCAIDDEQPRPRFDAAEGAVRLWDYLLPHQLQIKNPSKNVPQESWQRKHKMDVGWNDDTKYKGLILEHRMAVSRFGFLDLYAPLNEPKAFDTSLRDGSIFELSFL